MLRKLAPLILKLSEVEGQTTPPPFPTPKTNDTKKIPRKPENKSNLKQKPVKKTITLAELDIVGPIYASHPSYSPEQLPKLIQEEFIDERRFFPKDLTANQMITNMELVYIPYWVENIMGNVDWTAEGVEVEYWTVSKSVRCASCDFYADPNCTNCHGNGWTTVEETKSKERTQKIGGSVSEHLHRARTDLRDFKLLLSKKFPNPPEPDYRVSKNENTDLKILPNWLDQRDQVELQAKREIERILEKRANQEAGNFQGSGDHNYSRDVKIRGLQFQDSRSKFYLWLCPAFIGIYQHKNKQYRIQINAVTGEVEANVPITGKQAIFTLLWVLLGIAVCGSCYYVSNGLIDYFFWW